ncbi:hypothetical protein CMU81_02290 [Elizabethkingia anophelis]|nr:hypothetical protein [Elizabethkingia anophelis]
MENTLQKTFSIESLDVNSLPELQGLKEKQIQIRDSNPYVEITDNKTYEEAKKARTTLVSARTDIEKQEKVISKKINDFKSAVKDVHIELINITKPSEDKQQDEVRRYEAVKEAEKAEKERLEQERINKIKTIIDTIISDANYRIKNLAFADIASFSADLEENVYKINVAQFEEFELDFNEKLIQVKNNLSEKIQALTEAENQRLEKLRLEEEAKRLAEERAEIERKRKEDEEKLAAERKAEEDRLAKIKADQEAELQKERDRIASEKAKQDEELAAKQAEIEAENKKIQDEKNRLAKIESDRIAKEESERKAKEEEERKVKEAAEAEERAKAEASRLEELKPDKQKIIEYLNSIGATIDRPKISNADLENLLDAQMAIIIEQIQLSTQIISNFK